MAVVVVDTDVLIASRCKQRGWNANAQDEPMSGCGNRRFVSKLLVYEVTAYDEGGEQEFRRQHVRAEFEYTCSECQTTLWTLPADRRDYHDEVAVLETERGAALRDQLRQLGRRCWRRLAARTTWLALVLVSLVNGLVIWLETRTHPRYGASPPSCSGQISPPASRVSG